MCVNYLKYKHIYKNIAKNLAVWEICINTHTYIYLSAQIK